MKKICNLLIVLLLLGALIPLAIADEAENDSEEDIIDEETQEEVEIMGNSYGSNIRLLQLEKAITKNIVKGEYIISYLESNTSVNTTYLTGLLGELELLKDEVSSADPNSSDAVEVFVDLKYDAINISKEFRETLHSLVDNSTIGEIRAEVRNMVNSSVDNLGARIRFRVRFYNEVRLKFMAGYLSEYDSSLIEKYKNGSCNISQVKQKIGERVRNMSKEKRYQVFSELKQFRIKKKVQAQSCIANITQGFQNRRRVRMQNRLSSSNNALVKQAMQKRILEQKNGGNGKGGGW